MISAPFRRNDEVVRVTRHPSMKKPNFIIVCHIDVHLQKAAFRHAKFLR